MTGTVRLLVLLAVNALLALAVVRLAARPADVTSIAPDRRPSVDRPDAAAEAALDLSDLDRNQVISRPLFAPDRRAWQAPEVAAEPEQEEQQPLVVSDAPPDFLLLGVAISQGKGRALLFDNATGADSAWVAEGETFDDWMLVGVSGQSVRLERDGESVALDLYPQAPVE